MILRIGDDIRIDLMNTMKVVLAVVAAALAGAAPAHANDDTYLADVYATGIPPQLMLSPGGIIAGGHQICRMLHDGMSVDTVIDAATGHGPITSAFVSPHIPEIVAAAQRDICPDTLR